MTLLMGHTVLGVIYEFPHLCPGDDCAIGRWLAAKVTDTEWRVYTPVPEAPRELPAPRTPLIRYNVEIGKTWPELVAEHL